MDFLSSGVKGLNPVHRHDKTWWTLTLNPTITTNTHKTSQPPCCCATYHSAGTVPVFCRFRWMVHGSPPMGAALKLKSMIALVYTGTRRVVLWEKSRQQVKVCWWYCRLWNGCKSTLALTQLDNRSRTTIRQTQIQGSSVLSELVGIW